MKPVLSNAMYDKLKWIALVLVPGLGTLYFTLAGIWGLPYAEEIVKTLMALETFAGILLGVSNLQYRNAANER